MSNQVKYDIVAIDSFSGIAEKVRRSSKKMRDSMDRMGNQADKTRFKFSKLKAGIAAVAGGLVVGKAIGGFKKLVSTGADFEDSLLDLSALTGAQGRELELLAEKSVDLGVKYGASAQTVVQAMKLIGSAKPELLGNSKALTKMTEDVLLLKTASGMDLTTSVEVSTKALNQFGKSSEKAGEFINLMAQGALKGTAEIASVGQTMLKAGGMARALGLDFGDLNVLIQTVAKSGFTGAEAGTALQGIFSRFFREAVDIKKIGMAETFELIGQALEKTTDLKQKGAIIERFFGNEHSKVGLALINEAKLIRKLSKELRGSNAATDMAEKKMTSFNFKVRQLNTEIEAKLIQTFNRLKPKLLEMIAKFTDFISSITDEQIDAFANKMNAILHTIIKLTEQLEKIVGYLDTIGKAKKIMFMGGLLDPARFGGPKWMQSTKNLFNLGSEKLQSFKKENATAPINNQETKSTIDLNINAPSGVVKGVTNKTTGTTNLNIGFNGRLATNGI